jgi:hypothetical protein
MFCINLKAWSVRTAGLTERRVLCSDERMPATPQRPKLVAGYTSDDGEPTRNSCGAEHAPQTHHHLDAGVVCGTGLSGNKRGMEEAGEERGGRGAAAHAAGRRVVEVGKGSASATWLQRADARRDPTLAKYGKW